MSDPSASMLHKATIEKAERNEISNSARDMFKFVQNNYNLNTEGENRVLELHDAIDLLLNVVPPFIEEVRKNDKSRSTVSETTGADGSDPLPQAVSADHTSQSSIPEGDLVDISDMVPADPSSLPVSSVADRYTRSMLKCLAGYPLYDPKPFSDLSKEYPQNGVNVGDVGFVRGNGTFDFLFNICPPHNDLINPTNLSDGFSLETPDHSVTRHLEPLPRNTCLFQSPITRTNSGEYICEGSEGAVLELPEGAIEDEAVYIRPFEKLAARHGVQWYEHAMTRNRKISNGSLYLITSFTKCAQWGIAVFDRKCAPGQGLKFDKKYSLPFGKLNAKYHWKGSRVFPTKLANPSQGGPPNQCVFLRGYKIMIRQDVFDNLCNDQPHGSGLAMSSSSPQAGSSSPTRITRHRAWRIRGGGGTDPNIGSPLDTWTTKSAVTSRSDEVVLDANFNSSLIHPSDLVNAALLGQNMDAKVALTHDGVWCDLLRDNFPKLNYTTLIRIAQSYTSTVDEYGCVSLGKISDSSNALDESRPIRGTEAPALQSARDECNPDISMPAQASTTLRQHESVDHSSGAGDEGKPGISVPSQVPPSTPELQERDAQSLETQSWKARDSKSDILIAPPTVDYSLKAHHDYKYPVYGGQVYTPPPDYSSTYPSMPGDIPPTESRKLSKLNIRLDARQALVQFDVRKTPREAIPMNDYNFYGLQSAIMSGPGDLVNDYLRLYSKSIPWCIDIKAKGHPVMCRDVWNAIHDALQQEIDDSEWGMVVRDEKLRETVENAAKTRRKGDKKESDKIKRIDFLGEETIFMGLEKDDDSAKVMLLPGTQGCEETWIAVFSA